MLIATITALYLLFGGGAQWWSAEIKALDKAVKAAELAPEREQQARDVVGVMKQLSDIRSDQAKAVAGEIAEMMEDHGFDGRDMEQRLNLYRTDSKAFYGQMIEARFALKEALTEEEWVAVWTATHAATDD